MAAMTCVEKPRVLGIALCLIEAANKGRPRGAIDEFSLLECAVTLRIDPQEVRRVYKTLEELGWIDQAHLATWDERQPDKEDPTAKERLKRFRQRQKVRKKDELDMQRAFQRNETPRLDETSKEEATVTNLTPGASLTYEQAEEFLKKQKSSQGNLMFKPVGMAPRGNR